MLTARKRVHPFPTHIPANRRRSRYVSSSSSPSPRKRRRTSPYSSSSASLSSSPVSVGQSRKRCRSPAAFVPAASSVHASLSAVAADRLLPHKWLREDRSSYIKVSESAQDTDVGLGEADSETLPIRKQVKIQKIQAGVPVSRLKGKDVIFSIGSTLEDFILFVFVLVRNIVSEPVVPPVHAESTDELKALKDRAETAKTERTNLCERVRSLEISALRLKDTLRAKREAYARIERQLGFVNEEWKQSKMAHLTDRESLRRMETFLCRLFDYRMTPKAIKELIAQRVAKALATHEANRNIRNIVESGGANEDGNEGGNGNGNEGGNENGNGDGNENRNGEGNGN
ncbi:hypothetical protein Tco_0246814 [Tanacetum coccineum]